MDDRGFSNDVARDVQELSDDGEARPSGPPRALRPAPERPVPEAPGPATASPAPQMTPAAAATPAQPTRKHSRLRTMLFLLLPLALVIGGWFYVTGGQTMSTDNAYIRTDMLAISTDVSGIVQEVAVQDNQKVRQGQLLFRLDPLPFQLALDKANAQIGIVASELNALKASYRDMQAQIRQQQVEIDYDQRELDRQQQLVNRNIASQVTYEQAQRNLMGAQQRQASLTQQLAGILANLAGDADIPAEKHPRTIQAVAERDEMARQLAHTSVTAPRDGVVTNVPSLQPGQYLAASTAAFSIVASDHVWIEANPKETELTWVRPGQPAIITVDTYTGQEWRGTVDSVSPASAASFSLLPAQNSSGNWVKVVQRIPMRVRIETPPDRPPLRAGMSVVVDVDTGHARGVPSFVSDLLEATRTRTAHAGG